MRDFNDADRKKKSGRIKLPENPGNLSREKLSELENAVKAAVNEGYLPCPSAWMMARDAGISRLDVGAMNDKLGIRLTDCQLGCFKVSKTAHPEAPEPFSEEVASRVAALEKGPGLTCASVHALALELKVKPLCVAAAANALGGKMKQCQLGCF